MSADPEAWAEVAWAKLPPDLRSRAVARLRHAYPDEFFAEIRLRANAIGLGCWLPPGWHFQQGMTVRNVLRSDEVLREVRRPQAVVLGFLRRWPRVPAPIPDTELPATPELPGGQTEHGNWDDFYVQVLEAAAGLRGDFP